jgi:hypothetical protein
VQEKLAQITKSAGLLTALAEMACSVASPALACLGQAAVAVVDRLTLLTLAALEELVEEGMVEIGTTTRCLLLEL